MSICLIALGSNLGDREATIAEATAEITSIAGVVLIRHSRRYATQPVGMGESRSEFLNAAALCETTLSPAALLESLQAIETRHGRERLQRWSDRTLDLDLLLYDDRMVETPSLTLPHPRMSFRRFVLEPAAEIAGKMPHPTIGWSLKRLLLHLDTGADRVAIVSPDQLLRERLSKLMVAQFSVTFEDAPSVDGESILWPHEMTTWIGTSPAKSPEHPKLTILIDPATAGSDSTVATENWTTVCYQPGRGPTLRIRHVAAESLFSEAIAAMQAVWPALGPGTGERLEWRD
jgi:2-amino-4-hydroxy-6-hydroxymethyldihydropteridine diphosphokinase